MPDLKISELTELTTPTDADLLPAVDDADLTTKKLSWANLKATLKTYFDTLYRSFGGYVFAELSSQFTTTTMSSFVDVTGLSVTITTDGVGKLKISSFATSVSNTGSGLLLFSIREGSTEINRGNVSTTGLNRSISNTVILTPSAGSHTYKMSVYSNAASGTITVDKQAYDNAFIMAEII